MSQAGRGQQPDSEKLLFLRAIKAGDLEIVGWMIQGNPDLLFIDADRYVTPVMMATETHPDVADFLARIELQRLREGSVPADQLYGAIHDLGEAAHVETGYRGCEALRAEAEPVVAGFLAHANPRIRWVAVSVLSSHWEMAHYGQAFRSMGCDDPDESVKVIAIGSVGWFLRGSCDRDASLFLLRIFRDFAQPPSVRKQAYEGLIEIWQGDDSATRWSLRVGRQEHVMVDKGRKSTREGYHIEIAWMEDAWEEFVDGDFVARVEQEVNNEGRR